MWQVVQILPDGPDEMLSEHATEEAALAAARGLAPAYPALYVVRHDGVDVWTNESGEFERLV
jgi:hypothetical protein